MTAAEIHRMLILLQGWYGPRRVPADEATVAAWLELLRHHDTDLVVAAARRWGEQQHQPPTPADIVAETRNAAARRAATRALPAGCAACGGTGWEWLDARNSVRRCARGCRPPVIDRRHEPAALTDGQRTTGATAVREILRRLRGTAA